MKIEFVEFRLNTLEKRVFAKFKSSDLNTFELEVKREGLEITAQYRPQEIELKKLIGENKHILKSLCLPHEIKEKWELIEFSMLEGRPSIKVFDRKLEKLKEYKLEDLEVFGDLDLKTKEDLKTLVIHHQDRFYKEVSFIYHSYLDNFKNGFFSTVEKKVGAFRRKTVNETYSR